MTAQEFLEKHSSLTGQQKVTELVKTLIGPGGCPWDQKQTAHTMIDYVIDEAHELKSALSLEPLDHKELLSELGDLLFTVEFVAQSLQTHQSVDREEAAQFLVNKMVSRHPHVFADADLKDDEAIKRNWVAEKRKESSKRKRLDDDIPASLPTLKRAGKVLSRAVNSGFHYLKESDAWDKVCEEFFELESSLADSDKDRFSEELGDLLLSLLTIAKFRGVKAENSLQTAVKKFCDRLEKLEELAGRPLEEIPHGELRELYANAKNGSEEGAFFNHCGVSPWPRAVRNEIQSASRRIAQGGLSAVLELREEREAFRPELLEFVKAQAGSVACFVPNVSSSALGVAFSQNWQAQDKLLICRGEFPANTVPWHCAAQHFSLSSCFFDEDKLRTEPELAWAQLTSILERERPRLMAISAVSFWSGYRVDLERLGKLCASFDVSLFVDGIQALGTTPTYMRKGVSYLAAGSHKGLSSPECSGFLIVDQKAATNWVPRFGSWLSLPDPVDFLMNGEPDSIPSKLDPRPGDPTTLEGGSVNTLGYVGLAASIRSLQELDPANIFNRVLELQDPIEEAMGQRGWESLRAADRTNRSAILSFRPPDRDSLLKLHEKLTKNKISVGIPNGVLRFGFHHYNSERDVEKVLSVLKQG